MTAMLRTNEALLSRGARGMARGWSVLLILRWLASAGRNRSPEAQKLRHVERGDAYAAKEQYHEAILEYRNVLRLDGSNARAIRQLGLAYYDLGELTQAYGFLLKSQELDLSDVEVRLKLGAIYLLGGKPDEARNEASSVLATQPKNLEALTLLAGAASAPEEVDAAIRLLEGAQPDFGNEAKPRLALGTRYLRKQDQPAAERVFQEAATKDPKSVEAHSALGSE
jgi:Tfp pilus assembly protein PilF